MSDVLSDSLSLLRVDQINSLVRPARLKEVFSRYDQGKAPQEDLERAGGFAPLRHVPKDKVAVLGLVTTKSAELESVDELNRRIDEAARYLPLEGLALSPQCGFGGLASLTMSEEEQWRKLDRILEVAARVWR